MAAARLLAVFDFMFFFRVALAFLAAALREALTVGFGGEYFFVFLPTRLLDRVPRWGIMTSL
jgi:hypothetical protein